MNRDNRRTTDHSYRYGPNDQVKSNDQCDIDQIVEKASANFSAELAAIMKGNAPRRG